MHKHILARSVGLALLASGLLAGCGDKDGAQQAMGEMPPAAVDVDVYKRQVPNKSETRR